MPRQVASCEYCSLSLHYYWQLEGQVRTGLAEWRYGSWRERLPVQSSPNHELRLNPLLSHLNDKATGFFWLI